MRRATAGAAGLYGLLVGLYEIANSSIGWHLAAGRLILAEGRVPHSDPFSFTNQGHWWIDHEWLFQVLVALAERCCGEAGLVWFRALMVALLCLLLYGLGRRLRLSPAAALLLAALCTWGARLRFYLRPELFTLLLVPLAVLLYLEREPTRLERRRLAYIALIMAVGINLHGAVLVIPVLLGGLLMAEFIRARAERERLRATLGSGVAIIAAASLASLVNPFGWRVWYVPLHLAHLVSLPQVPNPEWFTPTFSQLPSLYVGIAAAFLVLALAERDLRRWALLVMLSILAVRYVRNVGLFFVLLPLVVAPSLALLPNFGRDRGEAGRQRRLMALALVATLLLGAAVWLEPKHRLHFGLSRIEYPELACRFMEAEGLLEHHLYHEVRFGGYLIQRYFPSHQVFIDDRNEIHIDLLTEMYEIFSSSQVGRWQAMLDRYDIRTALLRYNPSLEVRSPSGELLGRRGFSVLWFPPERWALVHWDETAMVLVRRADASPELLSRCEYTVIRPDDLEHLRHRVAENPGLKALVAAELQRALGVQPDNQRALDLAATLLAP